MNAFFWSVQVGQNFVADTGILYLIFIFTILHTEIL